MKLKSKKTGEIVEVEIKTKPDGYLKGRKIETSYGEALSLSKLNEDFEDYKEPKDFWFIDPCVGVRLDSTDPELQDEKYDMKFLEEIGLKFDTEQEARRAVEKLKAWKRLRDKGFKFKGFEERDRGYIGDLEIYTHIEPDYTTEYPELDNDLDLLFGGEE